MERDLLSRDAFGGEDAAVLRGAVSDGRDQLHVLPRAEREDSRRVEQGDARALQADVEGTEADHARCAAARLRGPREAISGDGSDARSETGGPAVSAPAEPEKGSDAV